MGEVPAALIRRKFVKQTAEETPQVGHNSLGSASQQPFQL
jgi:hypothetical protein